MTETTAINVYELARLLAETPVRTVVKPMHRIQTIGPEGPERVETGMVRTELTMPGYVYIREASYTRHPDAEDRISFSRSSSFVRRLPDDCNYVVDEAGQAMNSSALCALLDTLPHLQRFDLSAFGAD